MPAKPHPDKEFSKKGASIRSRGIGVRGAGFPTGYHAPFGGGKDRPVLSSGGSLLRPKDLPAASSRSSLALWRPPVSLRRGDPSRSGGFFHFFSFFSIFGSPFSRKFPEIALTMHFRLHTVCAFTHPAARGCRDRRCLTLPDSDPVSTRFAARKGHLPHPFVIFTKRCRSLRRPFANFTRRRRSLRRPFANFTRRRRSLRRPFANFTERCRSLRRPFANFSERCRSLRRPFVNMDFHPTRTK
jgi:hypothetical protein